MATNPAKRRRRIAPGAGSAKGGAFASPARRRAWISTICCMGRAPRIDGGRAMNADAIVEPDEPDRRRHRRAPRRSAIRWTDLVEKTAADPGAPFTPEVLEALAALKKDDRAAFEALRAQLKKAGCRVTALDEAIAEESGDTGRARADAGRHPDRPRANRRAVPRAGRHRLRRPRHQRPSRNLADPRQGLPPLAGAPLLRGDGRRAEFGGAAIGAERDRGQGAFRCARTQSSMSASAGSTAGSISTSATRPGGRWRSTPPAGG